MLTIADIAQKKECKEKITMLTAYDYISAQLIDQAGVDIILVGDSLGMVFQGEENTLQVSMRDMQYHTKVVSKAAKNALVVADLPFLSYQTGIDKALRNAGKLIQAGATAVKLEGTTDLEAVKKMIAIGIPVMGHLGFTPQSVKQFSGFKMQGKTSASAELIKEQAKQFEAAGAFSLVLEMVPAELAAEITKLVSIPVIGIGAGKDVDGQVLVITDVLGLSPRIPKFAKQYADLKATITEATKAYIAEVKKG